MVEGKITMRFGQRYPMTFFFIIRGLAGRKHKGVDIANRCGTPIKAPEIIVQTFVGRKYGYGNVIEAKGKYTKNTYRWAHLEAIGIKRVGKEWKKGEVFTWIGNTGFSTGCHVHIEKRINGLLVDPTVKVDSLDWLRKQINSTFRAIMDKEPTKEDNDYYLKRIGKDINDKGKMINVMKYWKSKNKTRGK